MSPQRCCLLVGVVFLSACRTEPPRAPASQDWVGFEDPPEAREEIPEEIPVVAGESPPPGYARIGSPNWVKVTVGLGAFVAAYVPPALIAAELGGNAWTMQVPIVGPYLQKIETVGHFDRQGGPGLGAIGYGAVGAYFLVLSGLSFVQIGGLVVAVLGIVEDEPRWVRKDLALVETPSLRLTTRFVGNGFELSGVF